MLAGVDTICVKIEERYSAEDPSREYQLYPVKANLPYRNDCESALQRIGFKIAPRNEGLLLTIEVVGEAYAAQYRDMTDSRRPTSTQYTGGKLTSTLTLSNGGFVCQAVISYTKPQDTWISGNYSEERLFRYMYMPTAIIGKMYAMFVAIGKQSDVVPLVRGANRRLSLAATTALSERCDHDASGILGEALEIIGARGDRRWQDAARRGLVRLKEVDICLKYLGSKNRDARDMAARALGDIGDERAVSALTIALQDKDSGVRYSAQGALDKISGIKRAVTVGDNVKAGHPAGLSKALPQLINLGSDTCVPGKMMMPLLDELTKEYAGRLYVESYDIVKNPSEGTKYGVKLIPTQIFFDATGKELFRHEGFFSKEDILAKWKELGVDLSGSNSAAPALEQLVPAKPDERA